MKKKFRKNGKMIWGIALVAVWVVVIGILLHHFGTPSVEKIVSYQPDNKLGAAGVMLGLFLLKSMDFIMYSGVLFAASGIMFPLAQALLLNAAGIVILAMIPYFVGKAAGGPLVERLREKYPKIQEISSLQNSGELVIVILMRTIGAPLVAAGLYMGAMNFRWDRYLIGSILCLAAEMVTFTVMGMSAADTSSPAFFIAAGIKILLSVTAITCYTILRKKNAAAGSRENSGA